MSILCTSIEYIMVMMYGPKNTVTPGKDLVETKQNKVDFVRILILIQKQIKKEKHPMGVFLFVCRSCGENKKTAQMNELAYLKSLFE